MALKHMAPKHGFLGHPATLGVALLGTVLTAYELSYDAKLHDQIVAARPPVVAQQADSVARELTSVANTLFHALPTQHVLDNPDLYASASKRMLELAEQVKALKPAADSARKQYAAERMQQEVAYKQAEKDHFGGTNSRARGLFELASCGMLVLGLQRRYHFLDYLD